MTIKLLLLLISSLSILRCSSFNITNIETCVVELPYSGDGYCKRVVSKTSRRIPKEKWIIERRTMVCLPADSYAELKKDTYKHCYNGECQQALDSVSEIFDTLDKAVSAVYGETKK